MRVSILSYKMPKISGPKYGCFSKLPHLPPLNNNSSFTSTYYQSYCLKHEKRHFHQSSNNIFSSQKLFAGRRSDYEPINQIKISTKLIAERYKKNAQLKEDTLNQRSWIGYRDPGIKAIEDYGINNIYKKKLPYSKSYLSLPINYEKNYAILCNKAFYGCPKKTTDITKNKLQIESMRNK